MFAVALSISGAFSAANSRGEGYIWSTPSIDTWSYNQGGPASGGRTLAPSFGGIFLNEAQTAFETGGSVAPSRLGSKLLAFETTNLVTPSLNASRYLVNTATVTVRLQTGSMIYTDQAITPSELLAQAQSGGMTSQMPVELFGVGFRGAYQGFALGVNQTGTRFRESTSVYQSGAYVAYPIDVASDGSYRDVSNNITGGYSATAPGNSTTVFEAAPWAIGSTTLSPGQVIPNDTDFTFEIDLSTPGVLNYLQQSLSQGSVGFAVSSAHPSSQPGSGGTTAYPQWYTKEAVPLKGIIEDFVDPAAATLSLEVTVLPLLGDYNDDGVVTELDYTVWAHAYGSSVNVAGLGADGNADGFVDAADYTIWRDVFSALGQPASVTIPEPSAGVCAFAMIVAALSRRRYLIF
jgi:hypothetical protein